MDSEDAIKQEYLRGEVDTIHAIERLARILGDNKKAEEIVYSWEDEA